MTKFNPEGKAKLTYGECLKPAMEITDESDAQKYLADYVAFIQKSLDKEPNPNGLSATQIAGSNLGYYAGYYDNETRERVERLFGCSHPIFGKIAEKGVPTAKDVFDAGVKLGKKSKEVK